MYDSDMLELEGEEAMRKMLSLNGLSDENVNVANTLVPASSYENVLFHDDLDPSTDI